MLPELNIIKSSETVNNRYPYIIRNNDTINLSKTTTSVFNLLQYIIN